VSGVDKVVVGWDQPLQSFFVQVYRDQPEEDDEEDPLLLWRGGFWQDVKEPSAAIAFAAPWAEIPDGLARQLHADRDEGL
jgi:hypothetical protein